ncbi:NAD(P)-dependent oxidoreductase [Burkholderia sp. FERM BP-3421]|jgi:citronellol/citronellal dehydrogenase|uniref:SDR family oxidoreductase n=1 Tax=Burkholderia sp. FERM BP-3421 TaxID=1494466 RepID=UPI00235FFEB3|nr:NAD(P)-dependent oxidoreductase [Burkholderia sp. FERM BP-3421]WDD94960.1 NAD(P)-dependent oxidoreductase [Burkholderia sp. FERM BP-3421]
MNLAGKTVFMSGGSRGIGLAIALRAARDGANVALAAKTATPHPQLDGTVFTAAKAIEDAGGRALPLIVDIRDEARVQAAVEETVAAFGGIDIVVNNASAIRLTGTLDTPPRRYDLMHGVNGRGTFVCVQACVPYLLKASNPHILTLSPPLSTDPRWFRDYPPYMIAKYTMSLFTLAFAAEFEHVGIAVNSLWPRTTIATAAVRNELGGADLIAASRKAEIMADAAHAILTQPATTCTGNFFIDDVVLLAAGVRDFAQYDVQAGSPLQADFFVDALPGMRAASSITKRAASS